MKIALLSFNRPGYLEQVIASIKTQNFDDYEIILFQDGAINKYSWRRAANQVDIDDCIEMFKDAFPNSETIISDLNIGIAQNWRCAEHTLFTEMNAPEVLFLEDDLILSKYYFETMYNMFNEFRTDSEIGMFNAYGEMLKEGNPNEMKGMGHLWSYGTTQKSWKRRQKSFDKYYDIVKNIDYAYRPLDQIHDLHTRIGARDGIANSQDGAKSVAALLCNQIKVSPQINMAKYIGEIGFHATPAFYNQRGFARMPLYEEGALSNFDVDKKSIRKELREKYMKG
tara:strand:+ start:15524 stop:16369 length:846 start_codon:yes stop_codon:yes gene_type:complete